MNHNKPLIPIYNRDVELKRSINFVLNQTYQNFEILIVDDCSEINLEAVVNEFSDQRLRYIRLKKNEMLMWHAT
jgi:teichuronic acid biosynthesis glycosyltransferase TuaG